MVDSDVLTVVLPYIREDFTAVQFKLLGLLRMLCDGQGELLHLHTTSLTKKISCGLNISRNIEMFSARAYYRHVIFEYFLSASVLFFVEKAAKTLGGNEEFMKRLIEWCAVEDHAGVKGKNLQYCYSYSVRNVVFCGVCLSSHTATCGHLNYALQSQHVTTLHGMCDLQEVTLERNIKSL